MAGEELQHLEVLGGEEAGAAAAHVEHADGALLGHQRHGGLGAQLFHGPDIALLPGDVGDHPRLAGGGHGTHDALAAPEAPVLHHLGIDTERVVEAELLAHLVEQQDGEGVEGDRAPQELGDPLEAGAQVEGGVQVFDALEQARQRLQGGAADVDEGLDVGVGALRRLLGDGVGGGVHRRYFIRRAEWNLMLSSS